MSLKIEDISNGIEAVKVQAVNHMNYEPLPPFEYVKRVIIPPDVNFPKFVMGCECADECISEKCECSMMPNDVIVDAKTFCSESCICAQTCGQRFENLRSRASFQVYFVGPIRRWGLRTLDDIPAAQILFEYAGVLSTNLNTDHDYNFSVTFNDEEFIIDAQRYGNLARFLNHSCAPNLSAKYAFFSRSSLPRVVYQANRKILAGEELTFDYGPLFWKYKNVNCLCDTEECKYKNVNCLCDAEKCKENINKL